MYVYVCIYIYIHMRVRVCVFMCIFVCVCVCPCACVHVCSRVCFCEGETERESKCLSVCVHMHISDEDHIHVGSQYGASKLPPGWRREERDLGDVRGTVAHFKFFNYFAPDGKIFKKWPEALAHFILVETRVETDPLTLQEESQKTSQMPGGVGGGGGREGICVCA